VLDSLEEIRLLRKGRHRHTHAPLCQENVRDCAFRSIVEVKEVTAVDLELGRPHLGERGMGAKLSQERPNSFEGRTLHGFPRRAARESAGGDARTHAPSLRIFPARDMLKSHLAVSALWKRRTRSRSPNLLQQ
jgi:hypothetical protein